MKQYGWSFLLVLLWGLSSLSCREKKPGPDPELASLKLAKGEVLLCGNGQFGKVATGFGCNPEISPTFDLALAMLHSFEYTEAEKAFVKVIETDPDCAMGYWGVAMSNFHPLWAPPTREELEKGSRILEIGNRHASSEKEKDYLNTLQAFYAGWQTTDHRKRTLRFEDEMRQLAAKYPEDTEATIFYALAMNAAADPADKTYTRQRKAGALLEKLMESQPEHPGITHYIIHNYDYPELAGRALPVARRYAALAPASAHAQHMPSHIFTRLGLWQEAIQTNLNSTSSALCYSQSIAKNAHWDEELHGMDYLVYAYLQRGEITNARNQLKYLQSFDSIFPVNFKVAYTAAAIPARLALETRDWKGASELSFPLSNLIPWEAFPWQKSLIVSAKSYGMLRTGDLEGAREQIAELKNLEQQLREKGDAYAAQQVEIQKLTQLAWLAWAMGNSKDALAQMRLAAKTEAATTKHPVTPGEILPAGEQLGDLYMEYGDAKNALAAYEEDMANHPNRFNGLFGAALAAQKSGNKEKAHLYFQKLLENAAEGSQERKELAIAREHTRS